MRTHPSPRALGSLIKESEIQFGEDGLVEAGAAGVDAGGDIGGRHLACVLAQVGRLLPQGDGVQVDHAEDAIVVLLHPDPVPHGAQVVAEVELVSWLDAGKNAIHRVCFRAFGVQYGYWPLFGGRMAWPRLYRRPGPAFARVFGDFPPGFGTLAAGIRRRMALNEKASALIL